MHTLHVSTLCGMWLACLLFGDSKHMYASLESGCLKYSYLIECMTPVNLVKLELFVRDSCYHAYFIMLEDYVILLVQMQILLRVFLHTLCTSIYRLLCINL